MTDAYELWDGAYVLGALSLQERREFESHLSTCRACRDRLAALSGLPGLLALAAAPVPERATVPRAAPAYTVFALKVRRRRARFVVAAAAAVLAVSGGTAVVTASLVPGTAPSATVARAGTVLHFAAPAGAPLPGLLTATGRLVPEAWGTTIEWTCTYANAATDPAGYADRTSDAAAYELVVIDRTGARTTVASWWAGPGATVSPRAATSIPARDISRVEITAAGSVTPLLMAEPAA
ncbi:zf-HC2 domain-containing protein [Specibacter cremeus]|uniref:zf-HC2 domain-containing protein n=1 Tax=Specibacter cremeus TaxID=1629051 RepID=UPI000F7A353A|nr:zf-HC2 domain-containing protein [Specibacter cremeus]